MTFRSTFAHTALATWLGATLALATALAAPLKAPLAAQPATAQPAMAQPATASKAQISSRTQPSILGTWRVSVGRVAPWVKADSGRFNVKEWLGQTIRFEAKRVAGPSVLTCGNARYEPTMVPAEGLFQAGIEAPAEGVAKSVGFATFPVAGTRLTCDRGIFEFHRVDADAMLVAIDNVIWTLDRSPGTAAPSVSPSGVVQRFLEAHFASGLSFDSATFADSKPWFTTTVRTRAMRYLAQPVSPDEAPALDGDPFTDSQEYPTRFSVGVARVTAKGVATVPVRFSDGYTTRTVTYVLQRGETWRISDVRYSHGASLLKYFAPAAGK